MATTNQLFVKRLHEVTIRGKLKYLSYDNKFKVLNVIDHRKNWEASKDIFKTLPHPANMSLLCS